jgi:hypothetical protein
VGTKTLSDNTNFQQLFQTVIELTNDTSVRSRRPIGVIYDVLNVRVHSDEIPFLSLKIQKEASPWTPPRLKRQNKYIVLPENT